jgi:hypothetical protein
MADGCHDAARSTRKEAAIERDLEVAELTQPPVDSADIEDIELIMLFDL